MRDLTNNETVALLSGVMLILSGAFWTAVLLWVIWGLVDWWQRRRAPL